MGDLKGHLIPGTMFIFFGLWWAVCALRRYFLCRRSNKSYFSSVAFSCPCACGKLSSLPLDSLIKIVLAGAGMMGELVFNLPHPSMGIIQHATMYFFFLISGVVDLTLHFGVPIPPGTDYLSALLAFGVEGLLFANHLHGRDDLNVHLHVLLCYVIFSTVIIIALEAKYQRSILLTLTRSFLTILQGTWFWAVGIILYGHDEKTSPWAARSHADVMKSTIYFSWHCAILFVILFLIAVLMSCFFRDLYRSPATIRNGNADISMMRLSKMETGGNPGNGHAKGYRALTVDDEEEEDGDSDIEFEKPVEKKQLLST